MRAFAARLQRTVFPNLAAVLPAILVLAAALLPAESWAIPVFARQTGQNCLACHAGGQFPELTPYGRKFKLTGYTMGERAKVPLAVMGVASSVKVDNTTAGGFDTANGDFPGNGTFEITTGSLFCCGKITDNLGLFGQWTYDRFDHQNADGTWGGHSHADQVDLRYADRYIDANRDLIFGASFNNSPGVTDVWNTFNAPFTPVPTYVPIGNRVVGGNGATAQLDVPIAPLITGEGQSVVGLTAYAFWNNTIYGEIGTYKNAQGAFAAFNAVDLSQMGYPSRLQGSSNTYWRLAYNRDWGANSAMVGLHGFDAKAYSDPQDLGSPLVKFHDIGVDGQYQYILDPHVVTAMLSWTHEKQSYPGELWDTTNPNFITPNNFTNPANASDTLDYYRAKITYVYQAKYGASLAYTSVRGSSDANLYSNSETFSPNSKLWVPEIFWTPVQYVRVGLQYYKWTQLNGSSGNVDTTLASPRTAANNNAVVFYIWAAY